MSNNHGMSKSHDNHVKEERPYLVTLTAEVVVEVEVEALSPEEAEAKADEWHRTYSTACGTVSGYWKRSDGESDYCDDKFDVVWQVMEVPYHEPVSVEELAEDGE